MKSTRSKNIYSSIVLAVLSFCCEFFSGCTAAQANSSESGFKKEEIEFYNENIKLSATIFIPNKKGKHPAIAVTHGSSKDSKLHTGFISLATLLVNEGFVVLIFDKRGVGSSTGEYVETPDMAVPAGDLISAVNFLKERKEVDKSKIGVYGHSQGGWVAPLSAANSKDISFVIVACGGGVSIREQVLYSMRTELKDKSFKEATIDSMITFSRHLYTYLGTGTGYTATNDIYNEAVKKSWFSFFKAMRFTEQLPPPSMLKESVFNFFKAITYDPEATIGLLEVPTFVMLAGKDEIVPLAESKQRWEDAFYAGKNKNNLTLTVLPNENHYDFDRVNGEVVYKRAFAEPLINWLKTVKKRN